MEKVIVTLMKQHDDYPEFVTLELPTTENLVKYDDYMVVGYYSEDGYLFNIHDFANLQTFNHCLLIVCCEFSTKDMMCLKAIIGTFEQFIEAVKSIYYKRVKYDICYGVESIDDVKELYGYDVLDNYNVSIDSENCRAVLWTY